MIKTVFLSPSNQKFNIGTGDYGCEARRMNEIANIMETELERSGIYVEREGDEIGIDERVRNANKIDVDAYVSLHSNYRKDGAGMPQVGTEIYVCPDKIESEKLARCIYSNVKNVKGFIGRGIRKNEAYKEVNSPKMPSCIIEIDFHDNYERSCWIVENMYEIAVNISKGILSYFGMPYKEKEVRKYYRIQLGAFTSKEKAEQMARALQNDGYPTVIKYY